MLLRKNYFHTQRKKDQFLKKHFYLLISIDEQVLFMAHNKYFRNVDLVKKCRYKNGTFVNIPKAKNCAKCFTPFFA